MRIVYLFIAVLIISCTYNREPDVERIFGVSVSATDSSLQFLNGVLYRSGQLFSGSVLQRNEEGKVNAQTSYYNGRQEGWSYTYFENGAMSEKRYYHLGEKDSVHKGWWQNGKPRFAYQFKAGKYDGYFREWYASSPKYKEVHYTNGKEDWAKGWRENGKVYMNFVVKDGRRYGIENSNLCYLINKDSLLRE